MNARVFNKLVSQLADTAIRGRHSNGNAAFFVDEDLVGVSIVHGYSGALGRTAVLLCATGPAGKESHIIGYDEMRSNNETRRKIGEVTRRLVSLVEDGVDASDQSTLQ